MSELLFYIHYSRRDLDYLKLFRAEENIGRKLHWLSWLSMAHSTHLYGQEHTPLASDITSEQLLLGQYKPTYNAIVTGDPIIIFV